MKRLEEIKKRAEEATKGPWESDQILYVWQRGDGGGMVLDTDIDGEGEGSIVRARGVGRGLSRDQQKKNLEFVAQARQDIPWLVDRLEKALQYLREGKAKYAPNTDNSFVDDLLKEFEMFDFKPKADPALVKFIKENEAVIDQEMSKIECGPPLSNSREGHLPPTGEKP